MQARDIAVLLAVARAGDGWTMRSIGELLQLSPSAIHRALERLSDASIYDKSRKRINLAHTEAFFSSAVRYLVATQLGGPTRGVPTAWGAEPLSSQLTSGNEIPVWADARGTVRGPAVEPLIGSAPSLVESAPTIYEDLALIDAIRIGDARAQKLATKLLLERINEAAA